MDKIAVDKRFLVSWQDYPSTMHQSIVIYMYGCDNGCEGCHNSTFTGEPGDNHVSVTVDELTEMIDRYVDKYKTNKVVLQGGDPLADINVKFTKQFVQENKDRYDICIFTGHEVDKVIDHGIHGFKFVKTGKYDQTKYQRSKKSITKMIYASTNQTLFDESLNQVSINGIYNFPVED